MDQKTLELESNFSILEHYGTYITNEKYITNPAIGRDEEIKKLILVLLTPEKSALLIGKPGIGKTAVVEGLAYSLQKNDVPDALKGYQIVNMKTASLLGTMPSGESKVQKMIDELKTKDKIILFIDEIHMLIGATDTSSVDFANIFKEGLGRGSIKVIGATTTEEYERYILRDKAFTRRFQKIEVLEPTEAETVKIMMGSLPKFEIQTGRKMKYTNFIKGRIMSFIVSITSEYKRVYALGSRYPDVSLTLLKQAFSYAVYDNRLYVDIFDVRKAIENSKNIYPDVIRKELVNFDITFKDLMLEEKGEKEIEEWRKEDIPIKKENEIIKEEPKEEVKEKEVKLAKVGNVDVSYGLKEKLNSYNNSKELDEILFSDNIQTISNDSVKMPIEFRETAEMTKSGADKVLFSKVNDIDYVAPLNNEEFIYKVQKEKDIKEEGDSMTKKERLNIEDQNFERYHNFFSRGNAGGYDSEAGRNPVDDFISYGPQLPYQNDGYQEDYSNDYDYSQVGYDNYNNSYPNNFGGYEQPNQYGDIPNGQPNYGDINYQYNSPSYGYANYNQDPQQQYINGPIYVNNPMMNQQGYINNPNPPMSNDNLFGAPMSGGYTPNVPQNSFDNLVTNSMRIKNGKIVDEFPTFEKLNNLSNITNSVVGDVRQGGYQNNVDSGNNYNMFNQPSNSFVQPQNNPQQGFMEPFPQNNFIETPSNQPQNNFLGQNMNPNPQMMNEQPQNMFVPTPQNNSQDKKWKFIDNNEVNKPQQQNTINFAPNNVLPTFGEVASEKTEGQFLDFGQLNKGKIKQEESNKYIGIANEERPTVDLNLETNSKEEKGFDDFFE